MNPAESSLADRLRADVDAICHPEGRLVGSTGHRETRLMLSRRLRGIGAEPWRGTELELPYEERPQSFCNLVGVIPGRARGQASLLIGAHYDSVLAAPCADDNAAAVAIALAVAEQVAASHILDRDLVVALFDAEEPPHFLSPSMGSIRFWEDQRGGRPIHAALVMDLVGHDVSVEKRLPRADAIFAPMLFVTGTESHRGLRPVLEAARLDDGLAVVPTLNRYPGDMSDHGIFRRNGVPYFFLSCGRWEHYHRVTDTPERLNYDKMARITRQVVALLQGLDAAELPQLGREQFADTLDLEATWLRDALGPLWEPLLVRCGLREVTNRAEMDKVAMMVLSLGL